MRKVAQDDEERLSKFSSDTELKIFSKNLVLCWNITGETRSE